MIHGSNESLSKLEFKNGLISFFEKNKIVEVVRVTNALCYYCTLLAFVIRSPTLKRKSGCPTGINKLVHQ